MAAISKASVKAYFASGLRPTESQFADLIDSYLDFDEFLLNVATAASTTAGFLAIASAATGAARLATVFATPLGVEQGGTGSTTTASAIAELGGVQASADNTFGGANVFASAATFQGATIVSGDATTNGELNVDGPLAMGPGTELTISGDSITSTGNEHTVDTESDAAADDLTTIVTTNMQDGALLKLTPENIARVVTVKGDSSGNITLLKGRDFVMDEADSFLLLRLEGTEWREISSSKPHTEWHYGTETDLTNGGADDTATYTLTGIPAQISELEILFNAVSTSGNNETMQVELGDSGGLETSGYDGSTVATGATGLLGDDWGGAAINVTENATFDSGNNITGNVLIKRYAPGSNLWIVSGTHAWRAQVFLGLIGGEKTLSGELTQFRFFLNAGNFDNGTMNYRYRW